MRITILFGGLSKERLVSVASAQALHSALPEADLWFWGVGGIEQALDQASAENRLLVLGLHGGVAENGELQAMCEMRRLPFTGSGSASSHLAFDKVAAKRF